MYVDNLKTEFYEFLSGKRIFLMVHYDIDSICCCKILQTLLRFKHILYTLVVVKGVDDLKVAFSENSKDVKYFVLINCGGTIDVVDLLEPDEDVIFFILDSHRPTDLNNIYSDGQIRLLTSPEDDQQVPDFHDIYRDDDEEDEEGDSGNDDDNDSEDGAGERMAKRRRLDEEAIMKRRERRLWEEKRDKILFEYSQFTFYSKASAIVMYDLAWKLNKDDKDLLWLAIIALTSQYIFGIIEESQYVIECDNLQSHVTRLKNRTNDTNILTSLKITYKNDLRLILYNHWSIEDSIKYSIYTAIKLKLWSHRGARKLQELLADMGYPLEQSRQSFLSMDLQLRNDFYNSIQKSAEKFDLNEIVFASFQLQYGYRNKYSASDIVYALLAILESSPKEKTPQECFNLALDCLSRTKKELIEASIEKAKIIARILYRTVQGAIDMKQITTAGPFIYYIIQEGCLDWYIFSHQHILCLLAHFIQRAFVSISRNRKAPNLPLIVSAPKNIESGTCVILGIPPLSENSPKNFFGKAYEQAADRINCDASYDYFDTSYFEIYTKDRTRFFDALTTLLT